MPACERVKLVNTPNGVEGDEPADLGAVAMTRTMAAAASEMMPLEKTSRWPRLVSCLGMKLSAAAKLARRGKSAKLVFGGQHQDQHRAGLEGEEQGVAEGGGAVDVLADLGDDRRRALLEGCDVHRSRPGSTAEEHHAQAGPHPPPGWCGRSSTPVP